LRARAIQRAYTIDVDVDQQRDACARTLHGLPGVYNVESNDLGGRSRASRQGAFSNRRVFS
jgi:hypothetical protein